MVIVDNSSPNVTIVGAWTTSTSVPGYYGSNYLTDGDTGKGMKSMQFTPALPIAGVYQVFARWTAASNRDKNVPIDVTSTSGTTTVMVNQQLNNNSWVSLGSYSFTAGTAGSVTIRTTGTTGYVIADAVEFVALPALAGIQSAALANTARSSAQPADISTIVKARLLATSAASSGGASSPASNSLELSDSARITAVDLVLAESQAKPLVVSATDDGDRPYPEWLHLIWNLAP